MPRPFRSIPISSSSVRGLALSQVFLDEELEERLGVVFYSNRKLWIVQAEVRSIVCPILHISTYCYWTTAAPHHNQKLKEKEEDKTNGQNTR